MTVRPTLRATLVLTHAALAITILVVVGASSYLFALIYARNAQAEFYDSTARALTAHIRDLNPASVKDRALLQAFTNAASSVSHASITILDARGDAIVSSKVPGQERILVIRRRVWRGDQAAAPSPPPLVPPGTVSAGPRSLAGEQEGTAHLTPPDLRSVVASLRNGPDKVVAVRLFGAVPGAPRVERYVMGNPASPAGFILLSGNGELQALIVRTFEWSLIPAGIIGLAFSILLGVLLGRRVAGPVAKLAAAARQMTAADLGMALDIERRDEVGELTIYFNEMSARLRKSFRKIEEERDVLKRFMQDFSHHFRTPLAALATFHELLAREDLDARNRADFREESGRQLERLTRLVEELMSLSRIEGGVRAPDFRSVGVRDLVAGVMRSFESSIMQKQLATRVDIEEDFLYCDSSMIEIAIGNALDNAIKASHAGAGLEILGRVREGGYRFEICDHGAGIPEKDLAHVFERFFRSGSAPYEGNGLGLSIARGSVEAHGGTITIDSRPGVGTKVLIDLPTSPASLERTPGASPTSKIGERGKT